MRKFVLALVAACMLMTAAPLPMKAANARCETLALKENVCMSFDCCLGMFGMLFGYRNYSGHREFGFYDTDGGWHCMWYAGYAC